MNTLRLWGARAVREFDLDEFNEGDYIGAVEARARSENICRVLYPNDNVFVGQGAAARPGVLLRLRHPAGHPPPLQEALPDVRRAAGAADLRSLRREGRHPAQRHPSRPGHPRADAHAGGRRRARLGRGVGRSPRDLRLHQPHRPARGAGALAGEPAREHAARGISRSSTRSTGASWTTCAGASASDDARARRMSIIEEDGERRVRMATLAIVGSHSVNGVAALHTRDPDRGASSATSTSCGPRSSATRPTASPSAAGCSSATPSWRSSSPTPSARVDHRPRSAAQLVPLAGDAAFARAWREAKRREQARAWPRSSAASTSARPRRHVDPDSLFDVQVKRIHEYKRQLLNVLHVITLYNRIKDDPQRDVLPRTVDLRRQGGAGLRHGQADHPADQRGRRRRERRPGRPRPARSRLPRRLPRLAGRADLPRRRAVRADLDRRHGGVGHRQHEVRPERRPDHRHHGRRQHRDPRGGRRRQHLHLRPDRRRGGGAAAALQPLGVLPERTPSWRACST